MKLYSYNGGYPSPLPSRIRLSNGMTKTDQSTFTPEDIADAGYVEAPVKPTLSQNEVLSWNGESLSWDVRLKTDEEIFAEIENQWGIVRNQRDRLLSETDFIVLKSYEAGVPVPEEHVIYRQELRDIPQSQTDPYNIVWPELYPES